MYILTDEALITEFKNTQSTALFGEVYDRFSKMVYNKCYSFVRNEDEAKDLTQDIFLKLYTKIDSFKGNAKFSTWLYSFTYNYCINYVTRNKNKKYEQRYSTFYEYEHIEDDAKHDTIDNFNEKFNYALSQISPQEKSILILKYQENISVKKLEELLGIKSSAVKMRVKRARERFALHYNSYNEKELLLKVS
jgi:RNA polymerase sigma-70 factor (ECF subfamily)